MIKKVLTVGCSFTYGEELTMPQSDAWPALIAKANNWQVINRGKGGGSNDRNIRIVIDEIENNYDLIIVAWTTYDRFEINYTNNNGVAKAIDPVDISITMAEKINFKWALDYYTNHHDRFYSYQKWLRQIILLQSYLKQCNQKYIFCNTFGIWSDLRETSYKDFMPKLIELTKQVDGEYYVGWPEWGMLDWMGDCPKGPGGHPLELGHQRIAEHINEHIRNLGWVS
jgi:lysophospholipase L1-like esterase